MKKSDLIDKLSESNNITVKDAERVLDIVINEITIALAKGNRAEFRGFGSFNPSLRLAELGVTLKMEILLRYLKLLYLLLKWQKIFLKN